MLPFILPTGVSIHPEKSKVLKCWRCFENDSEKLIFPELHKTKCKNRNMKCAKNSLLSHFTGIVQRKKYRNYCNSRGDSPKRVLLCFFTGKLRRVNLAINQRFGYQSPSNCIQIFTVLNSASKLQFSQHHIIFPL